MKRLFAVFIIQFCFLAQIALGVRSLETKTASSGPSQFELDKNLLEKVYQESMLEAGVDMTPISSGITISPQFSYFHPTEFVLTNNYWNVPYSDSVGGIPALLLSVATPLGYLGKFKFLIEGRVGYSYKEGIHTAISNQTAKDSRAVLTLHWLPLSLATRVNYEISGFREVKPYALFGAGASWLYQTGKLDGIEQGFWVPFYLVGAGLTLFESTDRIGNWFGGLNVGASVQNGFQSQQSIQSWTLDLGINFLM